MTTSQRSPVKVQGRCAEKDVAAAAARIAARRAAAGSGDALKDRGAYSGASSEMHLLERPAMDPIREEDDGYSSDNSSRDTTPMYMPGIRDHATIEPAVARLKSRRERRSHTGAYSWIQR
eukprot:gb/GFBE01036106.1/.p1 GENE.gb/GFBE01036106.1/~~gb/GFBE01036106.1/.p1  ORF type:complete len:120 (+),score=18.64 gb/GFBE01036106.1/:1-360(+)